MTMRADSYAWSDQQIGHCATFRAGSKPGTARYSAYSATPAPARPPSQSRSAAASLGARFCAFTGKAAHVLTCAGAQSASTIHRLIYRVVDERLRFERRPRAELCEINLIVVDECSMVNSRLGEDLVSFGIPILAVGTRFSCRLWRAALFSCAKNPT